MSTWQLRDAKNRFSALVEAALAGEPQQVTRRGKPAVVVLSVSEYERLCQSEKADVSKSETPRQIEETGAPNFIEHLLAIPKGFDGDGFELPPRNRDYTSRDFDF